jgi:O-acetyl-ADP-ribose deacetylase (regulator of RNase III)
MRLGETDLEVFADIIALNVDAIVNAALAGGAGVDAAIRADTRLWSIDAYAFKSN